MHTDLDTTAPNSEKEPDLTSPLVWRCFVNDYSLLQFLVERVQQEPVFKVQLLSYIEHSKKDKKWRTAAANAITILVRAGVQFVGTNLRGIQIPGADLSYGVFDSVRLQDADMRKVNFQGAWLRQTYLSRSDMTGAQFGDQPCLDVEGAVMSCASSPPDGESLVLGVDCGDIYQHSSNGHSRVVKDVKCSPQGNLIASCGWDGTIRLWDAETGICQGVLRGHEKMVSSIAFTPQGDQICSGGYDSTAQLWDVDTGTCQHFSLGNESTVGLAKGVCRIAHSPQGDQVAFASGDSAVDTWNATTREHSGSLIGDTETKCSVYCAVYSPDGNFIATACADRIVRLWNVETKSCINTFIGHSNTAMDVVFSPQGNQLASASADCTVRLWSVELGECSWILIGHSDAVARVAYSHKGDLLASGSSDKTVRLWDIATGQCRAVIRNLPTGAPGVTWIPSSDADYLVTSCEDGSVLKWQVTEVEGQCHVNLCWAATSGSLTAGRALIQDVRGLTPLDKQLLKQRGAYDVPENLFREVSKTFIAMAFVVS
jgi:WD40 repeat protein